MKGRARSFNFLFTRANFMISVIIPVYNVADYLSECVDSVLAQTYKDIEIILVNDGSTDSSHVICEKYSQLNNVHYISFPKNRGVVQARNAGIDIAKGEFIGFIDGDDWIEPTMYEKLIAHATEKDIMVDAVVCNIFKSFIDGRNFKLVNNFAEGLYVGNDYKWFLSRMVYNFDENIPTPLRPSLCNKIFRRDIMLQVYKEVNDKIYKSEDAVLLYKYLLHSKSIYFMNDLLYHYRYRENSVMHVIDENRLTNINNIYLNLKDDFKEKDMRLQLQQFVKRMTIKAINDFMDFDETIRIPYTVIDTENYLNSKVVIYGAGRIGKDVYYQLSKNKCQIVAWVDRAYEKINNPKIKSVETIFEIEFDYIIVAIQLETVAKNIIDYLMSRNIPKEKIIYNPVKFL